MYIIYCHNITDKEVGGPVHLKLTGLPTGTTVDSIKGYLSSAITDNDLKVDVAILGSGTATVKVLGVIDQQRSTRILIFFEMI